MLLFAKQKGREGREKKEILRVSRKRKNSYFIRILKREVKVREQLSFSNSYFGKNLIIIRKAKILTLLLLLLLPCLMF
jgi:hypothetical protein